MFFERMCMFFERMSIVELLTHFHAAKLPCESACRMVIGTESPCVCRLVV